MRRPQGQSGGLGRTARRRALTLARVLSEKVRAAGAGGSISQKPRSFRRRWYLAPWLQDWL